MKESCLWTKKCPICHSLNVTSTLAYRNEKVEQCKDEYYDSCETITTREKIYMYECNDCKHKYEVNEGFEKYTVFSKPEPETCLNDINLLATFEKKGKNYKIVSINYSPYNENVSKQETYYFMFCENDEYPILLSKQTTDEIIKSPEKALCFAFNNWMSRYR